MPKALSEEPEPLNILYYGDGGMGKTTHLTSMVHLAEAGQKLWLANAESGVKAGALQRRGIPTADIEVYPDPDNPEESISFEGIENEWLRVREELHKDPNSYIGTGWDSITEIQQALKDVDVLAAVAKANRNGRERSRHVVDQDNWRSVNEQCRQLIRKYRDLPCHFACSALSRREQDSDGVVVYQPGVTPGLQGDLVGWMDIVVHCSIAIVDGEEEFRGLLRAHGKYRGKDRFSATPRWLVDPTFDRIYQYVYGGLTVDEDEVMQLAKERAARDKAAA